MESKSGMRSLVWCGQGLNQRPPAYGANTFPLSHHSRVDGWLIFNWLAWLWPTTRTGLFVLYNKYLRYLYLLQFSISSKPTNISQSHQPNKHTLRHYTMKCISLMIKGKCDDFICVLFVCPYFISHSINGVLSFNLKIHLGNNYFSK